LRDGDRHDLIGEHARRIGRRPPRLAAEREGVLVGAGDAEILGHVVGGLGHGVGPVGRLHRRIDEAPADGRVVDFGVSRDHGAPGFGITKGARVMLSTPPAMAMA
jgi:hypothetical protein